MKKNILFSLFLFCLWPCLVHAASADLTLEGNREVVTGQTFSLNVQVSNIQDSNLMGIEGKILVSDESCFSLVSLKKGASNTDANDNVFIYSYGSGTRSSFVVATATFQAHSSSCSANVQISQSKLAFVDGTRLHSPDFSQAIQVIDLNNLKLNKTKISIGKTETFDLQLLSGDVVVNPERVSWKSGNLNVATVNSFGKITGVGKGSTTIEASYQGRKFSSSIEVLDYLKGDLDMNGKITVRDASLALSIYTGGVTCTPLLLLIGDMNEDGKIMVRDASMILHKYTSGY